MDRSGDVWSGGQRKPTEEGSPNPGFTLSVPRVSSGVDGGDHGTHFTMCPVIAQAVESRSRLSSS